MNRTSKHLFWHGDLDTTPSKKGLMNINDLSLLVRVYQDSLAGSVATMVYRGEFAARNRLKKAGYIKSTTNGDCYMVATGDVMISLLIDNLNKGTLR